MMMHDRLSTDVQVNPASYIQQPQLASVRSKPMSTFTNYAAIPLSSLWGICA